MTGRSHDDGRNRSDPHGRTMMAKYTGGRARPSRDEIARLAYHFYETRGRRGGKDVDDWLSAEQ